LRYLDLLAIELLILHSDPGFVPATHLIS